MAKAKNGKSNGNGKNGHAPKPAKKTAEALSEEQQQVLFFQHKRKIKPLIDAQKNATAALNKAYELAKKEGVLKKDVQLAIKMETEEGENSVKAELDRQVRIARWTGAKLGEQFEFFKHDGSDPIFEEGKRAAMDDQMRKPPEHLGQKAAQRWMAGFDEGRVALNRVRAEGFRPLADAANNVLPADMRIGPAVPAEVASDLIPPALAQNGQAPDTNLPA